MRLHNVKGKYVNKNNGSSSESESEIDEEDKGGENELSSSATSDDDVGKDEEETWVPTMEGFLKYLVDSKLVFSTIERIVDESNDVSCEFLTSITLFRYCSSVPH